MTSMDLATTQPVSTGKS